MRRSAVKINSMTREAPRPTPLIEDRVRFLSAVARALEERADVLDIVDKAATRDSALEGLRDRFGWDDLQARVVLDLKLSACTQDRRAAVTRRSERSQSRARGGEVATPSG